MTLGKEGDRIMEQLLKITNVPIAFEMKINKARLEYKNGTADFQISRNDGKMTIKSSPIRVNIDTFEARNSITPSAFNSVKQYAQAGKNAAYEATASMAQQGHMLLKAKIGDDVLGNIIASNTDKYFGVKEANVGFLPTSRAELNWSEPDITIDYQMDRLNFDWRVMKGDFEFIPGDIEMTITQYPDVKIEYVGGPIYVPASADPNYEPLDVKA